METLYICITLLVIALATYKFIKSTYPPRKSQFVTYPFQLELYKDDDFDENDDVEFRDPELRRLMGKEEKKETNNSKIFYMNVKFDLADVCGYYEWTINKFEDEKVYSNCTKVVTFQGDAYYIVVPFVEFDRVYEEYLNN
jgi:hypothetical protein